MLPVTGLKIVKIYYDIINICTHAYLTKYENSSKLKHLRHFDFVFGSYLKKYAEFQKKLQPKYNLGPINIF